jgi:glucose/arabinose dehydrogenase
MARGVLLALCFSACFTGQVTPDGGSDAGADAPAEAFADAPPDVAIDVTPPPPGSFCALAGSRVYGTAGGTLVLPPPQGVVEPDLTYFRLPSGYCVHYFATVAAARAIRFAPGGELFVSSPSTGTAGGAPTGAGAIIDVPDDNADGYGDGNITFQSSLPSTQGILFANSALYYQDATAIMSVPYTSGERMNTGTPTQEINITAYSSSTHWPKTLDVADDGTIYVSNGGDQNETCVGMPHAFHGGVFAIDGTPDGREVASGFRNAMYLRCERGHDNCFVDELGLDGSGGFGGREKLALFAQGQDWGYPCCADKNLPYMGITPAPDCSGVQLATDALEIGNTPFGLDFEPGIWPAPYTNNVFITLHGSFGAWTGARVVTFATDPSTGTPLPGTDLPPSPGDSGGLSDFITGWDDNSQSHGRPADITFAKDGRMFIANDWTGVIVWVAPESLPR